MAGTHGEPYFYGGEKGQNYIVWFIKNEKRLKFTNQSGVRYIRSGTKDAVDAAIAEFTLDKAKAMAKARVDEEARKQFEYASKQYHPIETGTWEKKQAEAASIIAWDTTDPPRQGPIPDTLFIAGEAGPGANAQVDLANDVISNANNLALLNASIANPRRGKKQAIDTAITYSDVEAVNPISGWPFKVDE